MLVIIDQVSLDAQDPNFKPGYIPGELGVYDPFSNVTISAYGLTDMDFQNRIDDVNRLWNRSSGVGSARRLRMKE